MSAEQPTNAVSSLGERRGIPTQPEGLATSMLRNAVTLTLGVVTAFGLFWVMQALGNVTGTLSEFTGRSSIEFVRLRKDTTPETKEREPPKRQKPEQQPACWLMSHAHASQTMKFRCTSVIVQAPPTPVPRRAGPPQLPLGGSARGIVNLGGGPAAQAGDPAFERFQQVDLQWTDIEAKEGEYNFSKLESLALSINASASGTV